jgi:MHS family proline/betaine transporter-like MFS transporter
MTMEVIKNGATTIVKPPVTEKHMSRAVVTGAIGNVMEWYDFGIYGYFAPVISTLFFPSVDPMISLLATFAVFGCGFIIRPVGGFIFGHYGDKLGRKHVLSLTMIMMGFSTFLIGVLPTYASIGVASTAILTICRLLQGFSAGGEWIGSTSFIVEYAKKNNRGFIGSWQMFSVGIGLLCGSGMGALVSNLLSPEAVHSWGWRLPFLFGIIIAIVGYYMRTQIEETPRFKEVKTTNTTSKSPIIETLKKYPKATLICLGFTINWTVSYYVAFNYLPTYVAKMVKFPLADTMLSNTIGLVLFLILVPLCGALSDRIGRKPILLASCAGFALFTYPLFILLNQATFTSILIAQLIFAVLEALFSGPGAAALAELFPTKIRYSALSVGYNMGVVIFGGMAPFICTFLIMETKNLMSPSYYVILGAVISLICISFMRETFKEDLQ